MLNTLFLNSWIACKMGNVTTTYLAMHFDYFSNESIYKILTVV